MTPDSWRGSSLYSLIRLSMLLRAQSDACLRLDLLFYLILIYIFNVTTKYYLMKIRSDPYHRPSWSVNKHTIELVSFNKVSHDCDSWLIKSCGSYARTRCRVSVVSTAARPAVSCTRDVKPRMTRWVTGSYNLQVLTNYHRSIYLDFIDHHDNFIIHLISFAHAEIMKIHSFSEKICLMTQV